MTRLTWPTTLDWMIPTMDLYKFAVYREIRMSAGNVRRSPVQTPSDHIGAEFDLKEAEYKTLADFAFDVTGALFDVPYQGTQHLAQFAPSLDTPLTPWVRREQHSLVSSGPSVITRAVRDDLRLHGPISGTP